jgi:ABC-type transport system substrate-binding protein
MKRGALISKSGLLSIAIGGMFAATCVAAAAPSDTGLASCPPRKPILRIAEAASNAGYSPHPAEANFASTHYMRLTQMPLFGVDPLETKIDPSYGVAQSWQYLPAARGIKLHIRQGLTFNNGAPVTAADVAISVNLAASKFADSQISGTLRGIGVKPKVLDDKTVEIDFAKGSPTFNIEMSPLVFPLYVTSKAYHSNGEISQAAFDKFRAHPLAGGPYQVLSYQASRSITLEAARKDPLLGCPTYDRIVVRDMPETGTRMDQFRTGQLDIILGSRDLIGEAKRAGASILTRRDANVIGLYIFQTDLPGNVFHNENVRKAAAYAIDHKLLEQTIWDNIGVHDWGCTWPPPTEISSENPRYIAACGTPYPYDPAKAKSLLAAAGYPPGKGPTIRLEYSNSYPEEAALAQAMQPMLDAVGFHAVIAHVDIATRNRERHSGGHINTLLFFGPGGRVTALAGSYSVWGPKQDWGPKDDKDVIAALSRASEANTLEQYTNAMADLGKLVHDRAYGPGFFSAGAIFFVRKGIPDWGIEEGKGRGLFNLAALATHR